MSEVPEQPYQEDKPRGITLSGWGTFLLGLVNFWRAFGIWRQSELLIDHGIGPDPRVRLALTIAWALIFFTTAVVIWTKKRAARWLAPSALLVYGLYRVFLSIFANQEANLGNVTPTWLIAYLLLTVFVTWSLNRPMARVYFDADG